MSLLGLCSSPVELMRAKVWVPTKPNMTPPLFRLTLKLCHNVHLKQLLPLHLPLIHVSMISICQDQHMLMPYWTTKNCLSCMICASALTILEFSNRSEMKKPTLRAEFCFFSCTVRTCKTETTFLKTAWCSIILEKFLIWEYHFSMKSAWGFLKVVSILWLLAARVLVE